MSPPRDAQCCVGRTAAHLDNTVYTEIRVITQLTEPSYKGYNTVAHLRLCRAAPALRLDCQNVTPGPPHRSEFLEGPAKKPEKMHKFKRGEIRVRGGSRGIIHSDFGDTLTDLLLSQGTGIQRGDGNP